MNKNLLIVFACILFCPVAAFCQCDSDSIVVQYIYENNIYTNKHEYRIVTDAYDRDSSTSSNTTQVCPYGWNWQPPYLPIPGNYDKWDTIKNSGGLPVEIIQLQHSGVGWIPFSKTIYTYNANLFKTGDYFIQWNGSAWDTLHYRIWIYDSSDKIISTSYYAGGNYQEKTDIFSSVGQVDSVIIYKGNINTWTNNRKFIFYYTGSLRTSADYYEADSNGNWLFIGQYQYIQNSSGQWVIHINQIKPTSVQLIDDTLEFEFDTLQNKVWELSYLFSDTITCSYLKINRVYIDSALYTTYSYSEDLEKSGNFWFSYSTPYVYRYTYDSYNRLITQISTGGCSHICGTDIDYLYDSFGRITHSSVHSYTFTIDNFLVTDYYYVDPGQMKVIVPLIEDSLEVCPDSSYQPNIIIAGGCEPYHYQWQPSTGLSSDTVLQPFITVNDTTSYTIYAHDDYGYLDTAHIIILPYSQSNHITFSNQLCDGSGELTFPYVPASTIYQWYSGSQSVATSSSNQYFATPPGNFWCYANFQMYSPHNFYCKLRSDTFTLLSPPAPVLTQSTDTLFVSWPGINYLWYNDSNLVANTSDSFLVVTHSGNYYVLVTDTSGCALSSNFLIVFPGVDEIENEKFYFVQRNENELLIYNKTNDSNISISIYDISGKLTLTEKFSGSINKIELNSLSPGIYLVKGKAGDRSLSRKILIE